MAYRTDLDKNAILQLSKQEREKRKLAKQQADAVQILQQHIRGYLSRKHLLQTLEEQDKVPRILTEIDALLRSQQCVVQPGLKPQILLKALPKLLTKLNLYLKLAITLNKLEFAFFKSLCRVLNEASVFLNNQQLIDDLKMLTRLIFTISMISQSTGDFRFKNELDTV